MKTSTALSYSSWGNRLYALGITNAEMGWLFLPGIFFQAYRKSKKYKYDWLLFPREPFEILGIIEEDDNFGVCDAAKTFPLPLCWNEQRCQIM